MKWLLPLVLLFSCGSAWATSCPVTTNGLTLNVSQPRTAGISPLLAFFDATGTTTTNTLPANITVTQAVHFHWNFGDTSPSGTGTWAYGSNAGNNSRNTATGIVAAHLYVLPETSTTDATYTVKVDAYDGTAVATCTLTVTANAPSGTNGFPGTATTCYFNTTVGTGCPSGATQTASSVVHAPAAGKRVLYKCGDTFTGTTNVGANAKWSVGSYGACANTPTTSGTASTYPQLSGTINIDTTASDGRVSDVVCNTGSVACVLENNNYDPPYTATTQITLNNLWCNATNTCFYVAQGSQQGYIGLVEVAMGTQQGTYVNYAQNNCVGGTHAYPCPSGLVPVTYTAMLGGHYDGTGSSGSGGVETVRVGACRMCVFEDNDMGNANNTGAVFKLHNGQYKNTQCQYLGQQTEQIVVSDNYFYGNAGAQLVEIVAQNGVTDERLQNIIVERNLFAGSSGGGSGRQLLLGAQNATVRNNVFNGTNAAGVGVQVAQRGYEYTSNNTAAGIATCTGTGTTSAPVNASFPQYVEAYNNVCYNGGNCVAFSGTNFTAPGNNSAAKNNLTYLSGGFTNSGTGNTVSNNSANTTSNPSFSNASGTFKLLTDFKPTANYTGASSSVDNYFDACGYAWSGQYALGPYSQACH